MTVCFASIMLLATSALSLVKPECTQCAVTLTSVWRLRLLNTVCVLLNNIDRCYILTHRPTAGDHSFVCVGRRRGGGGYAVCRILLCIAVVGGLRLAPHAPPHASRYTHTVPRSRCAACCAPTPQLWPLRFCWGLFIRHSKEGIVLKGCINKTKAPIIPMNRS